MYDVRNFLFTTDYPMPSVVWKYEGSIENVGSVSTKSITIPHNLGFTPLLLGAWSTNSDFNPSYDISNYIGAGVLQPDMQLNECGADNTNVVVEAFNGSSETKTLYFSLVAFVPSTYRGSTPVVSDTTKYQFSSSYNYPKIVKEGVVNINAGSIATIPHKLGYIPQVKVWGPNTNGRLSSVYYMDSPASLSGAYGPQIDENNLKIQAQYSGDYHYKIYGDEA